MLEFTFEFSAGKRAEFSVLFYLFSPIFCIKYTLSLVDFEKKKFNRFAVKCGKCSY